MLETLVNIKDKGHVIVSTPEHRLSLENMVVELMSTENLNMNVETGKALMKVLQFLHEQGREFLDESDEILSPKYQLIYTMGAPRDLDGSQLRFIVHGAILESVAKHSKMLQNKYGAITVEVLSSISSIEYPGVRLLENSSYFEQAYNELCKCVKNDILSKSVPLHNHKIPVSMTPDEREIWMSCVDGAEVSREKMNMLSNEMMDLALILRGVLSHGVLKTVLCKVWRVNYGAHPTRVNHHMAVPYRAKDVAHERADYGHPDIQLLLTFSTHYQMGLSYSNMRKIFELLASLDESEAKTIYQSWIHQMNERNDLDVSVNLSDLNQFETKIYKPLKYHMGVINFWLCRMVLPIQAKQFPKKLTSTSIGKL